jgi:hypothetical protein
MTILSMGTGTHGYLTRMGRIWIYFLPISSIHTLPVKSCIGYGYNLISTGIPTPYPFILACEFRVVY